jgi:hypothetical protein
MPKDQPNNQIFELKDTSFDVDLPGETPRLESWGSPFSFSTFKGEEKDKNPQTTQVASLAGLAEVTTKVNWSPFTFASNKGRNIAAVNYSQLMVFDVDEGNLLSAEACAEILKGEGVSFLILSTRHHGVPKKGKPACDRYRVILVLKEPVEGYENYKILQKGYAHKLGIPEDTVSNDLFYYKSVLLLYAEYEGLTIDTSIPNAKSIAAVVSPANQLTLTLNKRRLSSLSEDFLSNGAPDGTWNSRLFKAAADAKDSRYSLEEFTTRAEAINGYLDDSDHSTIASAFKRPVTSIERVSPHFLNAKKPPIEDLVLDFLDYGGATYEPQKPILYNGNPLSMKSLHREAVLTLNRAGHSCDKELVQYVLERWKERAHQAAVERLRDKLRFTGENPELFDRWVRAIVAPDDGLTHLHSAILKHFIWQVKRKVYGLEVDHHNMPVLFGKSDGGKTRALAEFLRPLEGFIAPLEDLSRLNDSRELQLLKDNYVLVVDELARAERVQMDKLKNLITAKNVNQRMFGTQTHEPFSQNATLIGSSNYNLTSLLNDPTGVRRFWEIPCLDRLDWATINSIDYVELWQSVDENGDSPVEALWPEIREVQETHLRRKDTVEEWLEEHEYIKDDEDPTPIADLYFDYRDLTQSSGSYPLSKTNFITRLQALGFRKWKRSSNVMNLKKSQKQNEGGF